MKTKLLSFLALAALLLSAQSQVTDLDDLTALTTPVSGDLIPVWDIDEAGATKMKKTTFGEFKVALQLFDPASPGAIGGTTPSTGAFTSLSTTGILTVGNYVNAQGGIFYFGAAADTHPMLLRSSAALHIRLGDDSNFAPTQSLYQRYGAGTPEGSVTAPIGSIYHRTDGGAGTAAYRKESGTGNTGWVAITTGGFSAPAVVGSQTWGDGSTDTIVWTFDRATGTDPTMTIGDGVITFSGLAATTMNVTTLDATTLEIGGVALTPSAAELNFVDGVTSAIQTQLDTKLEAGDNIGAATATTPAADDSDTSVATTAFVQGEITPFVIHSETFTILEPDAVQGVSDTVILKKFIAEKYPNGVTITSIHIDASAAYTSETFLFQHWDDAAGTTKATVESIAASAISTEDDGTLSDATIPADFFLVLDLDATPENVAYVSITISYTVD